MGENSCELVESVEKCFTNCSQVLRIKGSNYPTPKTLRKKLLQIATKHRNLQKFSPSKVFHYTVCMTHNKPHIPEKRQAYMACKDTHYTGGISANTKLYQHVIDSCMKKCCLPELMTSLLKQRLDQLPVSISTHFFCVLKIRVGYKLGKN